MSPTGITVSSPAPRRRKPRRVLRVVLSILAIAWAGGCIVTLMHVFSAVRVKCAGCAGCAGTAP